MKAFNIQEEIRKNQLKTHKSKLKCSTANLLDKIKQACVLCYLGIKESKGKTVMDIEKETSGEGGN